MNRKYVGIITLHPIIHAKHIIENVDANHLMSNAIVQDCYDFYHISAVSAFILQLMINCIYKLDNNNFKYNDMNKKLLTKAIDNSDNYYCTKYTIHDAKNRLIKARILDKNGYLNFNPLFIGNHVNILLDDGTRKEYITYIRVNSNRHKGNHYPKVIDFNRAKKQLKSNA